MNISGITYILAFVCAVALGLILLGIYAPQETPPVVEPEPDPVADPEPDPVVVPDPDPVVVPEPGFEPLKTSTAVNEFAVGKLFNCVYEGDSPTDEFRFQTTDTYPLPLDGFGYYGYPATTLIDGRKTVVSYNAFSECVWIKEWFPSGAAKSGSMVWRVIVDPNNGWLQELVCDYETFPDKCPKDDAGEFIWVRESPFNNPDIETYKLLVVE